MKDQTYYNEGHRDLPARDIIVDFPEVTHRILGDSHVEGAAGAKVQSSKG